MRESSTDAYSLKLATGDYDGGIIRNVYEGNATPEAGYHPITDYIINTPNQAKLADAVTYDDMGNIIPLSKRDNFSIKDFRYALFPAMVSIGAATQSTEKKQQGGQIKPIVGKVSGIQRSSINNNQDYFEQHFTTELDGGTNYSGIMGNNEYFVRKTPDGKYMYNIQGENGTIFQGENESSLPADARKFLDSLYNVGIQRFPTKRHDNGGQIKPNFIKRLKDPNRKSILD